MPRRQKFDFLNPEFLVENLRVEVPVRRTEDGTQWVFINPCPFCGRKHLHGAPDGSDGGHRVAHCPDPAGRLNNELNRSYILVPVEPGQTEHQAAGA